MSKIARTDHPVHDLIANRWSPYGFSERLVSEEDLLSLLEAARWAPSSYNEQPWRYILAPRNDPQEFERLLSCLTEGNQKWARQAAVLMLGVIRRRFSLNGKPNRAAEHDLGLASANLCVEATARGIAVHQMIGILPERARELYAIPEDCDALTGIAIGYTEDPGRLPEDLRRRDTTVRTRKPLAELVYRGSWEGRAPLVG